ncbi:MAG: hypothetical protein K2Y29_08035 [Beijerinckiaceae bacterium]|nr:hypothetical protein [Beijerinckiaceae bacterium]
MSQISLLRRAFLGALSAALATFASPVFALEIRPDPQLHLAETQQISVGEGRAAIRWNIWTINKAHYGGEGKIVWALTPFNPIPGKRKDAEAWYQRQLKGITSALGGEKPKRILASMEMAGSSVVTTGPPFAADFNLIYDKREQVTGNIYVMNVMRERGRLIVLDLSPGNQRALPAPAAEFAKFWSERLRDAE